MMDKFKIDMIDMWVISNNDKLDPIQMQKIRSELEKLDKNKAQTVMLMELKSPTTMLITSILVGTLGIDRFMLGQIGMGSLKLLTLGCLGILTIIDWFIIMKKTKEYNFKNLINALM